MLEDNKDENNKNIFYLNVGDGFIIYFH